MQALRTDDEIRDVNTRYHDVAAAGYDTKWGIDFGEVGQAQVSASCARLLGGQLESGFERSLEIGAGTGYFSLNLLQAGVVRHATCTDISPGMLAALELNAQRLGLEGVLTEPADATELPFADESFDLVLGHAVLHHLPDLDRAFAELYRVLTPNGRIVFAGEPSRYGDRLACVPKRAALALAPVWRMLVRARPAPPKPAKGSADGADHELEPYVDIHSFAPDDLAAFARRAGFADLEVRGEELHGELVRVVQPGARSERAGRRRADALASVCIPRIPGTAAPRSAGVRAAPACLDLLQPDAERSAPGDRRRVTVPEPRVQDLPLFPLGIVVLPSEAVPLHIFEERYKTMIGDCLERESRVRDRLAVR